MIGYDTVKLPYNDIVKSVYLRKQSISMEPISVIGINKKSKKRYTRLEKNVRKVYPYALKISDLLVEAGGIFFTELLNNNLVDEIHLFKSKIIIGKYGKPAIVGKKLSQLNLSLNERKKFKDDIYTNYQVN